MLVNLNDCPTELINVDDIEILAEALREAQIDSPQFQGLMEDISKHGFIHDIVVRKHKDPEIAKPVILCDGAQRTEIAKRLGVPQLKAKVLPDTVSADEALVIQMGCNLHRVDTRPAQYAKQIKRLILAGVDDPAKRQLKYWADVFSMSEQWIKDRLRITHMPEDIQTRIDAGEIPVANAIALSKSPDEELTREWVDRASAEKTEKFVAEFADAVKTWNAGHKDQAKVPQLQPTLETLRKAKLYLKAARQEWAQVEFLTPDQETLLQDPNIATLVDRGEKKGFKDACEFMLKVDAGRVEEFNRKLEEEKILKEAKKAEKDAKKATDALEAARKKLKEAEERQRELGVA